MARQTQRLNAKQVENLKRAGMWPDGAGLYLQVTATRAKSWVFRYARGGKSREMGLGSARDVSLADARRKAADARKLLADGKDPLEAKKARKLEEALSRAKAVTFDTCADAYITAHSPKWKNAKHGAQWRNTIATYASPVIGGLAVQDVDTGGVLRVLEPIWESKNETATRLRARLEQILDYAAVRGLRTGPNPAAWRGHLSKLLPALSKRLRVQHHPSLHYSEVAEFVAGLRTQPGVAAQALEFLVLCASRTGEVIGARPEEFDLAQAVWVIPKERMKSGREHRVPLSRRAVEIVKAQPAGDFVFSAQNGKPLSNGAMLMLLKRMGRKGVVPHGFRSTFRSWAGEKTNTLREVAEQALAHVIASAVERAYMRGDLLAKRRRLMDDWAKFCETRTPGAKIVPIKAAP